MFKRIVSAIAKTVDGRKYYSFNVPKDFAGELDMKQGDRYIVTMVSKKKGVYGLEFIKKDE